jgi:RES domain-containing protein
MMKRKNISIVKFLVLLAVLTLRLSAVAQTYPVQTNVSATGPYYNYLSYFGDENNHLQAIVTLTDFNSGPIQAKLRIRIEGPGYEAYTNPNLNVGVPFTLEPGVPNFIQGFDLAPYLQSSNLIVQPSGVNLNKLPEGFTTVCIDVIRDGTSAEVLSTNNCTAFYLQLFQPSQAIFPVCASNLNPDEQFYTFQWTPPIGYVPSFGSELNYTFSLYEWNDPNNYNIFETGQGLVYQAQTMNAMLQLSQFDVLLQEGTDYVWRIESEISNNGMPVDMIQNNGLSEICTFTYGESLTLEEVLADGLMIDINADGEGERKGKAYWTVIDNTPGEGLSDFDAYIVEYRKKPTGNEGFELTWFEDTVPTFNHFIYQLEPSTTYEVNVRGMVGPTYSSDRSNTVEFTTSDPRVYGCGEADLPFLAQTYTPLENALAGMQFEMGQFTMRVTEIQAKGAPGHYEGKGVIPIAFLGGAKAKVRFDDILVDNQFVVREGQIDVVTDGLDNWLHQQYGQFVDPIYVNGTVDSAYVDTVSGSAWVVVDGIPLEFVFEPADYPIIINDESGYQYTIWPNGTIEIGTYLDYSNDYLDVGANDVATFAQSSTEVFGFDAKEHMEWHENYEVILLPDSTHYFVANKSLGAGSTQNGRVNVVLPSGVSNPSFEINGTQVSGFSNGVLTLPSDLSAGEHALYVKANNLRIGKLNLIVYAEKIKEVVIVPMTSDVVNETAIATAISQTFGEANITVNLTVAPQWNDATYTNSKAIVLPQDVGVMNKYSDDMRELRDAYFADSLTSISEGAYYVFIVPSFSDNTVDGYMVRGRALGFVASGASPGTYAHELGHGIGALSHTWKDNGPHKDSTNNLMDYAGGNELTKAQWKELRDSNVFPSLWDDAEDAEGGGGNVHYYKVCVEYFGNNQERIVSRDYLGRFGFIKQGPVGSENCTTGSYTTGVNKFFRLENGTWEAFRYEHFGKVFYMSEVKNSSGDHVRFGEDSFNSNSLTKTIGGTAESANGVYEVRSMYLTGNNTPYAREVRNFELIPLIDHYLREPSNFSAAQGKALIAFNDLDFSNEFQSKLSALSSGTLSYGNLVLWLESHPKHHNTGLWTSGSQVTVTNNLLGPTNDINAGPVFDVSSWGPMIYSGGSHSNQAMSTNDIPAFAYNGWGLPSSSGLDSYMDYRAGMSVSLLMTGSPWTRTILEIDPSGYYSTNTDDGHVHKKYGANSCTHSLTKETNEISGLIAKMNDANLDAEDIAEYIASKDFCFLYGLSISDRKALITKLIYNEDSWLKENQNILNQVILTSLGQDEKAILDYFKASNFAKFRVMFNKVGDAWANSDELHTLLTVFSTISKDLLEFKSSYPQTSNHKTITHECVQSWEEVIAGETPETYESKFAYIDFPIVLGWSGYNIDLGEIDPSLQDPFSINPSRLKISPSSGQSLYPMEMMANGTIKVTQYYHLAEVGGGISNIPEYNELAEVHGSYYLSPYDMVDVVIGDNYGAIQYDRGKVMTVPAMTALLMSEAIENARFDYALRVVTDVGIIAVGTIFAPVTGGGSLSLIGFVATLEITAATADIFIATAQNGENTAGYNDPFYQQWNRIKMLTDIGGGVFALPGLANGAFKIGQSFLRNGNSILYSMAMNRAIRTSNYMNDLAFVDDFIKPKAISHSFATGEDLVSCINFFENLGGGGSFVASSGVELVTYLDDLVALPAGKTYNGNMYRSINSQYNNPLDIHPGAISSNYRYSRPGEGGLYLSKTQSGNVTEISHYGDISNYTTYEYPGVQIDNMLDLTDDAVRQQLAVDFDILTMSQSTGDDLVDAAVNYEFTHEVGTWAANNGYKGIIVPGARGNKDYVNTIIFNQADVNSALSNITPNIINN